MVVKLRQFVVLMMGIYLSQVVLFSTHSCWRNQQEYTHGMGTSIPRLLSWLTENRLLNTIAHTCGYASGYGFYAPRVGSHFLTEFRLYTDAGEQTVHHYPQLKTLEGRIRYRAFTDLFSNMIPREQQIPAGTALHRRILRAVARSLSERLAARQAAARVECHVGVWYPAPLHPTDSARTSHYVELFETHSGP